MPGWARRPTSSSDRNTPARIGVRPDMARSTILGFVLTVGVLVPAGWHLLRADIEMDGKRLRPLRQTLDLDGVKVTLDVDREVVMTGDTVKATLVAYADTPRDVAVDVHALHTTNYSGER